MKSVLENICLSEELSHQIPWNTECLTPSRTPLEGVEGQQLRQHRVQSPQGDGKRPCCSVIGSALGRCHFVSDRMEW